MIQCLLCPDAGYGGHLLELGLLARPLPEGVGVEPGSAQRGYVGARTRGGLTTSGKGFGWQEFWVAAVDRDLGVAILGCRNTMFRCLQWAACPGHSGEERGGAVSQPPPCAELAPVVGEDAGRTLGRVPCLKDLQLSSPGDLQPCPG